MPQRSTSQHSGSTHSSPRRERAFERIVVGTSISELVGGAAAVILSILGLGHDVPTDMAAGTAIVLGAAFAFGGGLLAVKRERVLPRVASSGRAIAQLNGGVGVEALAGIAAIVLGVLTLLNVAAAVLMPVSALVLVLGMLFGGGVLARLKSAALAPSADQGTAGTSGSALPFATILLLLVGLGAVVLAILALIGFAPVVLSLVALLALGFASMLTGASVTSRMLELSKAA